MPNSTTSKVKLSIEFSSLDYFNDYAQTHGLSGLIDNHENDNIKRVFEMLLFMVKRHCTISLIDKENSISTTDTHWILHTFTSEDETLTTEPDFNDQETSTGEKTCKENPGKLEDTASSRTAGPSCSLKFSSELESNRLLEEIYSLLPGHMVKFLKGTLSQQAAHSSKQETRIEKSYEHQLSSKKDDQTTSDSGSNDSDSSSEHSFQTKLSSSYPAKTPTQSADETATASTASESLAARVKVYGIENNKKLKEYIEATYNYEVPNEQFLRGNVNLTAPKPGTELRKICLEKHCHYSERASSGNMSSHYRIRHPQIAKIDSPGVWAYMSNQQALDRRHLYRQQLETEAAERKLNIHRESMEDENRKLQAKTKELRKENKRLKKTLKKKATQIKKKNN